mmetsp:Transcript_12205/g.18256  ORF Transcript_12205/g.18256 Transcript_12205/m.18256 type:complete len:230 (-) Transcript_12205:19-708(-)
MNAGNPKPNIHILDRRLTYPGSNYSYQVGLRDVRVGSSSSSTSYNYNRTAEVSLSAFGYLMSEMVQYSQTRVNSIESLERRLEEAGFAVGLRVLEIQALRERTNAKRKLRFLQMLQWISTDMWKVLFGKTADSLERSTENTDEYMIHEFQPITNVFVSVPPDLGQMNCAAYIAGIIAGALEGAFFPAVVSAHSVEVSEVEFELRKVKQKTVFLIKFSSEVMQREEKYNK